MNDEIETPQPPVTRNDLRTKGLQAVEGQVKNALVSGIAGGVQFQNIADVIEVSKLMAVSDKAVPAHLRANPGMCLAVTFQAIEWRMSPFAVAQKSYVVNDRIAYESQLIHGVIEARAPLQRRLDCHYTGEGPEMKCTVVGQFTNGDIREYESPMLKDIKTKNSPLWQADVKQQLWYFSSRSWARKWCPDVLMGIYSKDELEADPTFGRDEDGAQRGGTLMSRLPGRAPTDEGNQPNSAERELASISPSRGGAIIDVKANNVTDDAAPEKADRVEVKPKSAKAPVSAPHVAKAASGKSAAARVADRAAKRPEPQKPPPLPKNVKQYAEYAEDWIRSSKDADDMDQRWKDEKTLRNNCGLTEADRKPIEAILEKQRSKLANE